VCIIADSSWQCLIVFCFVSRVTLKMPKTERRSGGSGLVKSQIGMFRPIRMDHTNCLRVAIKSIQFKRSYLSDVDFLQEYIRSWLPFAYASNMPNALFHTNVWASVAARGSVLGPPIHWNHLSRCPTLRWQNQSHTSPGYLCLSFVIKRALSKSMEGLISCVFLFHHGAARTTP
jgi:hypothetical protein